MNEQQLQQQLQRIYKNANVFVECYNYECKNIIDLLFANTTQRIYMYNWYNILCVFVWCNKIINVIK